MKIIKEEIVHGTKVVTILMPKEFKSAVKAAHRLHKAMVRISRPPREAKKAMKKHGLVRQGVWTWWK